MAAPPARALPKPTTAIVNELCRILSDLRSPVADLPSALVPFSASLSPSLALQVLARCRHLPSPSHRFFLWSSSLPSFRHLPESHSLLLFTLSNSLHFPLAWAHLSDLRDSDPQLIRPPLFHLLFRSYSKAHLPDDAVRAFHKMPDFGLHPNIDDFHCLLSSLCRYAHVQQAQDFFHQLKTEFPIDQKSYSILMQGWANAGKSREAVELFDEMAERGVRTDLTACNTLLAALCQGGEIDEASKRFKEMRRVYGFEPDAYTYAVFVRAYCKEKDVHSALRMVENMRRKSLLPNVYTYNCVVKLLCEKEKVEEAYELMDEMVERGAKPDVWSYNTVLAVHCRLKEVNKALRLLARMDRDCCLPDKHTYNMLLKMLIGVGRIDRAMEVWDGMEGRGFHPAASNYAVMIHGLCRKKGRVEDACRYFEVMMDEGVPPYQSTCELLRGQLLQLGLRDRVSILAEKMRQSSSCTIQELSGAMEKNRKREEEVTVTC